LTNGSFDRVSLVHSKLKFFALLIAPSLLQLFVVGSDKDGAMGLSARDAGCFMRAAMTLAPELKTIGDFTAFLLSELTAIGAGLSIGTDRNGAKLRGFGIFLTGTFFNSRNRVEQDDLAYLTHMLEEFFKPPVIGDGLHEEGSLCL